MERHRRRLGRALGDPLRHLGELVAVSAAGRARLDDAREHAGTVDGDGRRVVEPRLDLDPALGADDRHATGAGAVEAAGQRRHAAAGVAQVDAGRLLDARRVQAGEAVDRADVAEESLGEVHDVDAEVEDGAAAEIPLEQAVAGLVVAGRVQVALDRDDLADPSPRDDLARRRDDRLEARPHGLHREDALRAGRVDHLLRADEGGGEGLLDENGLAVRDGRERDVAVVGVRRRDVDDVDLRRLEQLPVRPVGVFHPVASGELLRLLLRPGRDRGQLGPGHELEVTGDPVRDRPQTDNSPANRAHASRLVGRG